MKHLDGPTTIITTSAYLYLAATTALSAAYHLTGKTLPAPLITLPIHAIKNTGNLTGTQRIIATTILVLFIAVPLIIVTAYLVKYGSYHDRQAKHLKNSYSLSYRSAKNKATKLKNAGLIAPTTTFIGHILGIDAKTKKPLYADIEATMLEISGMRTGKTVGRAIPIILNAPGAVIATSNKPDIYNATENARGTKGRIWVFDPQNITNAPHRFYWNPLTFITTIDEARALAHVFADVKGQASPSGDAAFWNQRGTDLLAALLYAAALNASPITEVWNWLANDLDRSPIEIIKDYHQPQILTLLEGIHNAPERTRASIYTVAQSLVSFLQDENLTKWITPSTALTELHPEKLIQSTDTIYLLSQKGGSQAASITAALTMALATAAENAARMSPTGRLTIPLTLVLDEAANVFPWRELPDKYSFYGSLGILPYTCLQSYKQGENAFGANGMNTLWSAAAIKIYAGGSNDPIYLKTLSDLTGELTQTQTSHTYTTTGRSTQTVRDGTTKPIYTIADLAALPQGKLLILATGAYPTLANWLPYFKNKTIKGESK